MTLFGPFRTRQHRKQTIRSPGGTCWPTFWPKTRASKPTNGAGKIARSPKIDQKKWPNFLGHLWSVDFKDLIAKSVGRIMQQTMANLLGWKNISITGLNFSEKFRQNGDLDPKWGPRGSDPQKTMENRSETPQINPKIEFYVPEKHNKICFSERVFRPEMPKTRNPPLHHYILHKVNLSFV